MQDRFKVSSGPRPNVQGQVPRTAMAQAIIERSGLEVEWVAAPELVRLDRWCDEEFSRSVAWGLGAPVRDLDALLELVDILNDPNPDRDRLREFLVKNPDLPWQEMLFPLVSESRQRAVSDYMRARGRKKSQTASDLMKKVAWRWLEYKLGLVDGREHSKNSATELLAAEFHKSPAYIRDSYLRGVESKKDIFPDGIAAAEQELRERHRVAT